MSAHDLGLYVSSNGVDHGPLSLKEAMERIRSGNQACRLGVAPRGIGMDAAQDLPEWNAMQAAPALPLAKKPTTDEPPRDSAPPMGSNPKR